MVGVSRKVFLIWSVFLVSVAATSYSWVDVPYGDHQAYDLEGHPLYISTYADKGSGQTMGVYLLTDDIYDAITSVQWRFSDYSYIIYYCSSAYTNKLTNVPAARHKIWKITKNDTALTILCNGVQVLSLVYDDPSLEAGCKSRLRQDVKNIWFYFNPYSSVPNRYLPAGAKPPCNTGYYLDVGAGCVPCLPGTNSEGGNVLSCRDCWNGDQSQYDGYKATTVTGRTCQKWTAQSPQGHTRTPEKYPNRGLGDHNYCRNPDSSLGAWCYTTDVNKRWEYCGLKSCGV